MESAVDPRMQYVYVGDVVFIRRSTRATYQKAEVVSVTPKHGFVTVEWTDNKGYHWGREVTIKDVLDLNPNLVTNRMPHVPGVSSGPVVSYLPTIKVSARSQMAARKEVEDNTKRREAMQARVMEAKLRDASLPKNQHSHHTGYFDSRSENCDDVNDNPSQTSGPTTQHMILMGSKYLNEMPGCASNQEAPPPDSQGSPQAESQERPAQGHNQFTVYKIRSPDDPLYSPLMEEMYAKQKMQVEMDHAAATVAQHRNACNNKNKGCSFPLQNTYSNASTKNNFVIKPNSNNFKRSPAVSSSSKNAGVARRPPTAVPAQSLQKKPNSDRYYQAPSNQLPTVAPPRHRPSVVDTIKRLERERELRRRKQEEKRAEETALRMKYPGNVNWKFALMVNEYRRTVSYEPLQISDPVKQAHIIVCIRKRPLNAKEIERKEIDIVTIPKKDLVLVHEPKEKLDLTKYLENHCFRFDYAFDENSSNELVYHFTAKPLIETFFEGGIATVFAYGQTGSGKTHTMGGNFNGTKQDSNNGIYMNVARDIFGVLSIGELGLRLSVTFYEIYKGKLYDLLSGKTEMKVMEDIDQQIQIVGLTEMYANSLDEVVTLIGRGNAARTSGKTVINPVSSRSHSVLQLILRQDRNDDYKGQVYGKFSLIDLAGNERGVGKGVAVDRQLEVEGAEINKSLLALKECIRALARNEGHIPFRGSKLTLVLKDTFMNANSRVCMIGTVSPGKQSCNCSLNTILYANRVKEFHANDPFTDDASNGGEQQQ